MAEKYIKQAKKGEFISHAFLNMNSKCKKNKNFKPMSIAAEGGCVAIADCNHFIKQHSRDSG